ncbi:MAG: hypothetical protein NPIRA02_02210 [Nitrospirales bacterium]|nr:MAG: hypothetical protein NPIRA02_02210 [Nitrospirales bacterium]
MMSSTTVNTSHAVSLVRQPIDQEAVLAPYFFALEAYEEQDIERRNQRMLNARTPWENRFEDEDPDFVPPTPPSTWLTPRHYVTLADGRRAIRLDERRALPLCGIQSPVLLTEAEQSAKPVYQGIKCGACGGFHLPRPIRKPKGHTHEQTVHTDEDLEVRCPKCHASVLEVQHEGPFFTIHCFCGFWKEGQITGQGLSQAELDHNERALASAPVRDCSDDDDNVSEEYEGGTFTDDLFDEACEKGRVEVIDEDLIPFSEESEVHDDAHSSTEATSDTLSESDEHLVALENRFWLDHRVRPLRVALLEATVLHRILDEAVNLVWAVAANLAESCEHLSAAAQREVADWLCQAYPEDLEGLLPEQEDQENSGVSRQLPDMQQKIRKWQRACRDRVNRFRYRQAGIRILAPKFGVSQQAFAAACQ